MSRSFWMRTQEEFILRYMNYVKGKFNKEMFRQRFKQTFQIFKLFQVLELPSSDFMSRA